MNFEYFDHLYSHFLQNTSANGSALIGFEIFNLYHDFAWDIAYRQKKIRNSTVKIMLSIYVCFITVGNYTENQSDDFQN